MPKKFIKTRECGCIVLTTSCGTKPTENGKMYLICGHKHITICDNCQQEENNGDDTLHDMWLNDNITNDSGYGGWVQHNTEKSVLK